MAERAIVDTGFLVALLNRNDAHHAWAAELVPTLKGPWLTAEACISEAVFPLEQAGRTTVDALLRWLEQGALVSRHCLPDQLEAVRTEMLVQLNERTLRDDTKTIDAFLRNLAVLGEAAKRVSDPTRDLAPAISWRRRTRWRARRTGLRARAFRGAYRHFRRRRLRKHSALPARIPRRNRCAPVAQ